MSNPNTITQPVSSSMPPPAAPRVAVEGATDPSCITVGDRFEKRGRRVIDWRVNAIANPPRGSPIVTFVEIDGTACLRLRITDIIEMGFQRVGSAGAV